MLGLLDRAAKLTTSPKAKKTEKGAGRQGLLALWWKPSKFNAAWPNKISTCRRSSGSNFASAFTSVILSSKTDGDTRTWLFTILHNVAVNHLRGAARRGREVLLDDAGESDVAVPSTQEDALRRDDILGAVGQLPDDQRSVLLLVSVEDVTYAEAARILDIPIGTVMSRLARYQSRSASASDLPMSNYSSKLVPYGSTSPAASTPAATTIMPTSGFSA